MDARHRDGVLAVCALLAVLTVTTVTGRTSAALHPGAVVGGVGGAVGLELAFLRYPDRLLTLWDRPGVAVTAAAAVLVAGVLAAFTLRWLPWVLVWGLLTYLAVLGCLLAGVGNPLASLARVGRDDDGD